MAVFSDVTECTLVEFYQRFGGTNCFHRFIQGLRVIQICSKKCCLSYRNLQTFHDQRRNEACNKQGLMCNRSLRTFPRNIMPPPSGSKIRPRKLPMPVNFHKTTQPHIPEDTVLTNLGRFRLNRTQVSAGSLRRQRRTIRKYRTMNLNWEKV
jgi:hypothetical protein